MTFDEFLARYNLSFNEEQKAAILAADGPVCLLASPGSGTHGVFGNLPDVFGAVVVVR